MIKLQAEKYCQITGEKCIGHEDCAFCPVQENTQFTCTRCGERWNLLSDPNAETDICPVCGITVKSDSVGLCSWCGGSGQLEKTNYQGEYPQKYDCPVCNGTGKEPIKSDKGGSK